MILSLCEHRGVHAGVQCGDLGSAHCNLCLLGSSESPASASIVAAIIGAHHYAHIIFVFLVETRFNHVGQAGLELLTSSDPLAFGPLKVLRLQEAPVGGNLNVQAQLGVHDLLVLPDQAGHVLLGLLQGGLQLGQLAAGVTEGRLTLLLRLGHRGLQLGRQGSVIKGVCSGLRVRGQVYCPTHLAVVPGLSLSQAAGGNVVVLSLDLGNDTVHVQVLAVVQLDDCGGCTLYARRRAKGGEKPVAVWEQLRIGENIALPEASLDVALKQGLQVALTALAVLEELQLGLQQLVLLLQEAHLVWKWEKSLWEESVSPALLGKQSHTVAGLECNGAGELERAWYWSPALAPTRWVPLGQPLILSLPPFSSVDTQRRFRKGVIQDTHLVDEGREPAVEALNLLLLLLLHALRVGVDLQVEGREEALVD
ncbi:hypothetical protein AAY473_018302 [Plecturocebus cupreus]